MLREDQLVEIIRLNSEGHGSRNIAQIIGCGKSTINDFLARKTYAEFWEEVGDKPIASGTIEDPEKHWKELKGKRFILTSAQNNTFVHGNLLKSLQQYAEFNDSELIVGTFTYNKNAYYRNGQYDVWYDPKIQEYIHDEDCLINETLMWCGSLNILPTAVNPLSGFESYVKSRSGIIPHAKLQMQSLPVGKFDEPRLLYTTGTVTQRNYIHQKAGQKASFHHVYGALAVEIDEGGDWFVRQLIADDDTGEFYDLEYLYTPECVYEVERPVEGLQPGDIHAEKMSPDAAYALYEGEGNMIDSLMPKYVLLHDVFDMHRRNHHTIRDPYHRYKMHCAGTESVEHELKLTTGVISDMMRDFNQVVVVQSNHDLALKRWLMESDFKSDPVNAELYLDLQKAIYRAIRLGNDDFDVFPYACSLVNPDMEGVRFLKEDESFMLADEVECSQHGHNGNNGARGSVAAFRKQGRKHNKGHDHTASIFDGVNSAGACMTPEDSGYAKGGTTWSMSHIVTYVNAKRCIVTQRGKKWRA